MRGVVGFVKSIMIYYNPLRFAGLKRFYRQFVVDGSLCFDIGAHVGNRTAVMIGLGASVIALEPQRAYYRLMRFLFGRKAVVLPLAAGKEEGKATIKLSPGNPTLATLSDGWISTVSAADNWKGIEWTESSEVKVTSLDELIRVYGKPGFVKIDVEGYEHEVLLGLSEPVRVVSIEFMPADIEVALACVDRLAELGSYIFNLSFSEQSRMQFDQWVTAEEIKLYLGGVPRSGPSGDIYAKQIT